MALIVIDGSQGEGGGQVLRTSLALSLATGTAFRIENIRAKRDKPGLLRQHLTAVQTATAVGDAAVEGAALGSSSSSAGRASSTRRCRWRTDSRPHLEVIRRFLDVRMEVTELRRGLHAVSMGPARPAALAGQASGTPVV